MECFSHRSVSLRVIKPCGGTCPKKGTAVINMEEELHKENHCIKMFHSLIPYIISFEHRAWFKWERYPYQVTVCCSHTPNNCAAKLCLPRACDAKSTVVNARADDYQITISSVVDHCPCYEMGKTYPIRRTLLDKICLSLFLNMYPYYFSREPGRANTVTCAQSNNFLVGEISS